MFKTTVWLFVAGLALGTGVLVSSVIGDRAAPEYRARSIDEIAQSAEATDQGITVEVLGAAFSGTETVLRTRVTSDVDSHGSVMPTADGFVPADFGGTTLEAVPQRDGQTLLILPRFMPPPDYDGSVRVELSRMGVQKGANTIVSGSWTLELEGPDPSIAADLLKAQRFGVQEVTVHSVTVTVSGVRSATETRIEVNHPGAVQFLGMPTIRAGGANLLPQRQDPTATGYIAHFPPTEFGSAITVDLGTVGFLSGRERTTLTVDMAAALRRAEDGAEEFAIDPSEILTGPAELVMTGNRGSYGSSGIARDWVGIRLRGSWYPVQSDTPGQEASPVVHDGDGKRLPLAHVQTDHSTDDDGNISPGETDIAVFVNGSENLSALKFELGRATASGERPMLELTPIE